MTTEVICPYCNNPAKLITGKDLYPHRPDLFMRKFWQCKPCDAYCGCHKPNKKMGFDGTQPLGRLADKTLRHAKTVAHSVFDPLWQEGSTARKFETRKQAYQWLATSMCIAVDDCHIGSFDLEQCWKVSFLCKNPKNLIPTFSGDAYYVK
jgi:hypothetical protein